MLRVEVRGTKGEVWGWVGMGHADSGGAGDQGEVWGWVGMGHSDSGGAGDKGEVWGWVGMGHADRSGHGIRTDCSCRWARQMMGGFTDWAMLTP